MPTHPHHERLPLRRVFEDGPQVDRLNAISTSPVSSLATSSSESTSRCIRIAGRVGQIEQFPVIVQHLFRQHHF